MEVPIKAQSSTPFSFDIITASDDLTIKYPEPVTEPLPPGQVLYGYDSKGSIVLPPGPPFDGKECFLFVRTGWVTGYWDMGAWMDNEVGREYDGWCWRALDDNLQFELDEVVEWRPIPEDMLEPLNDHKEPLEGTTSLPL